MDTRETKMDTTEGMNMEGLRAVIATVKNMVARVRKDMGTEGTVGMAADTGMEGTAATTTKVGTNTNGE